MKYLLGIVLLAVVAAIGYWTTQCPCERFPGAWLAGDVVQAPVDDWSFANDVGICFVEVPSIIAHSVTLNCMSADGRLYLSCSQCEGKRWSTIALEAGSGRIRIGETVYPVSMSRVTTNDELDLAWRARAMKLAALRGRDVNSAPPARPDHWWSFRLASPT